MNELLETIKAIIICGLKNTPGRVTKDRLQKMLESVPVWSEDNRKLTQEEKIELYEELSNYYIADIPRHRRWLESCR